MASDLENSYVSITLIRVKIFENFMELAEFVLKITDNAYLVFLKKKREIKLRKVGKSFALL